MLDSPVPFGKACCSIIREILVVPTNSKKKRGNTESIIHHRQSSWHKFQVNSNNCAVLLNLGNRNRGAGEHTDTSRRAGLDRARCQHWREGPDTKDVVPQFPIAMVAMWGFRSLPGYEKKAQEIQTANSSVIHGANNNKIWQPELGGGQLKL